MGKAVKTVYEIIEQLKTCKVILEDDPRALEKLAKAVDQAVKSATQTARENRELNKKYRLGFFPDRSDEE